MRVIWERLGISPQRFQESLVGTLVSGGRVDVKTTCEFFFFLEEKGKLDRDSIRILAYHVCV